jgi:hypothetical protein
MRNHGVENPSQSEESKSKRKKTNLERYGVENPSQSEEVQERQRETWLMVYGVDHPSKSKGVQTKRKRTNIERHGTSEPLRLKSVRDKIKNTLIENHGVAHPLQSQEILKKTEETNLTKYGVRNVAQNPEISYRVKYTQWKYYYNRNKDILKFTPIDNNQPLSKGDMIQWKCCGNISEYVDFNGPLSARCPICDPPAVTGTSRGEIEVLNFVESIYKGVVLSNDRTTISPKELDIFVPEKKLAIEYNGVYWHSSGSLDEEYLFEPKHIQKTEMCRELGINLFHINEFDWNNPIKREIVQSMISHKLGISETIHARKTTISNISSSEASEFLERNHLQGSIGSKYRVGLYFENRLVSLMTFGVPRFNRSHEWELLRFCNLKGVTVVGGASKLLKFFRTLELGSIISYANRSHSIGTLYENLGFELIGETSPSYVWFNYTKLYSSYETQKHILPNILGDVFDPTLSEAENMYTNGYRRLFDSGNFVYSLASN